MTIDEMIEGLERAKEELGGEAEVLLATQPNWPMRYAVAGIALLDEPVIDEDDDTVKKEDTMVCWIVEGEQGRDPSPYAPQACWDSMI